MVQFHNIDYGMSLVTVHVIHNMFLLHAVLFLDSQQSSKMSDVSGSTGQPIETGVVSSSVDAGESEVGSQFEASSTVGHDGSLDRIGVVVLYGQALVCLYIDNTERLSLAHISNTLLRRFSYNDIHNRRVALGITCVQCTPGQVSLGVH